MINVGTLLDVALPIAKTVLPTILNYKDDYGVCSEGIGEMRPALPINGGNINEVMQHPLTLVNASSIPAISQPQVVTSINTPKVLVKANIEVYVANDGVNYEKANEISFDKSFAFSNGTMSAF